MSIEHARGVFNALLDPFPGRPKLGAQAFDFGGGHARQRSTIVHSCGRPFSVEFVRPKVWRLMQVSRFSSRSAMTLRTEAA